jgi:hypothetical protein
MFGLAEIDWHSGDAAAALIGGVVALIVSLLTSGVTFIAARSSAAAAERRLRREFRLEFAAEDAARELLERSLHINRSFSFLQHRLKGFEPNELRKILVRCGALHVLGKDGEERWGLRNRNPGLRDRTHDELGKDLSVNG